MSSITTIDGVGSVEDGIGNAGIDTGLLPIEVGSPDASPRRARPQRAPYVLRKESVEPNKSETTGQAHSDVVESPESLESGPDPLVTETTREGAEPPAPPDSGGSGWAPLVAQVLAIALVSACITLLALKFSGLLRPAQVRVVTFDVLKYENAERAASMKLMGQGGSGAVAPMLSYVSKRLRSAIRQAAGPGTLVVLSQAVVQGQTRDITDQVLKDLGLPTNVPTAAAIKPVAVAPSTVAPPIKTNAGSPLSRLINAGAHTKAPSIVP